MIAVVGVQARQVHIDGVDGLRAFGSGMLHGVGIDGDGMNRKVLSIGIFPREHFAISCPAAWRGIEIGVGDAGRRWGCLGTAGVAFFQHGSQDLHQLKGNAEFKFNFIGDRYSRFVELRDFGLEFSVRSDRTQRHKPIALV